MTDNAPLSSADQVPSHNGLKALVIGLGILILIGLTVLIGTIFWRVSNSAALRDTTAEYEIALPSGAEILDSDIDGENLVLRLSFSGDSQRQEIWVINHVTGKIKSRIDVKQAP
jgi:hypothetical protein